MVPTPKFPFQIKFGFVLIVDVPLPISTLCDKRVPNPVPTLETGNIPDVIFASLNTGILVSTIVPDIILVVSIFGENYTIQ